MINKIFDKYKTGKEFDVEYEVSGSGNSVDITLKNKEYIFKLGDLINDFIDHKNKPFWKRGLMHKFIENDYIMILNNIKTRVLL